MPLEAQEVAVRVRLVGASSFQNDARKVDKSISDIGAAAKRLNVSSPLARAGSTLTTMGAKAQSAGKQIRAAGSALLPLSAGIGYVGYKSVQAALSFNQAMTLLQTQARVSGKDVADLSKKVMTLPAALGSPTELANGLYAIASSGKRGTDAMNALQAAAMGARVGIDTIQNTSQALMGTINTGLKGVKPGDYMGTMAILDQTVGVGMMHLPDLMEAMHSEIVPMAKHVGLGLQDILGALSGMTRMNIPAQKAANLMKLTLTKMFAPTGAGLKALQSIGLTQFQLADDLRKPKGLIVALEDLKKHLDVLPKDQQNAVLAAAFGQSRGISNISALLEILPSMKGMTNTLYGSNAKTFQQHYQQTINSPSGRWQTLKNQLEKSLTQLGIAILPTLLPLMKELTQIVADVTGWFQRLSPGTREFIIKFAAIAMIAGPVLIFFGGIVQAGGALLGAFGKLISFGAGPLMDALSGLGRVAIPGLVANFGGLGADAAVLGGTEGFLGLLGPIGLLAGALVAAYIEIKPFHKAVNSVVKSVMGLVTNPVGQVAKYGQGYDARGGKIAHLRGPKGWLDAPGGGWIKPKPGAGMPKGAHLLPGGGWFLPSHVPALADGGTAWRSGMALVGEAGPELLTLPVGARVDPLPQIGGMTTKPTLSKWEGGFGEGVDWHVTVETPVYLDGQMIAKTVNRVNRTKANRR